MDPTPFNDLLGQWERLAAIKVRIMHAEAELRAARQALQKYMDDKRRHEAGQHLPRTDVHPILPVTDETQC